MRGVSHFALGNSERDGNKPKDQSRRSKSGCHQHGEEFEPWAGGLPLAAYWGTLPLKFLDLQLLKPTER